MTLEELQVLITANTTELKQELNKTNKELKMLEKSASKSTNNIAGFFKKMIPIGAIALGLKKVSNMMSSSEQAYKEQIQNETRLLAVMTKRGEVTKQDIQDILDLTDAQQKLGVVSDEVQLAGAQELSTYISKASSIKDLIPQLNNMIAQQYGYNATQEEAINIATMMGKVLEGQTGALSRYGYYFDENEEKILKFGTEEEKVATLTSIINDSIGDVNEALGNTAVGKQIQLANAWSDVKEQLGYVIVQVKQVLVPVFQVLVTWLGTAVSYLRQFLQVLGFTAKKQNGVNKAIVGGADAEEDYGDAVEDSTKKQNKQLAAFDEMNVLKEDTDSESDNLKRTGNDTGIGGVNDIDFNIGIDGDVEVSERIQKLVDKIKKALSTIWNSKEMQAYFGAMESRFKFFKDLTSEVGKTIKENFKTTWGNIKDNLADSTANMGTLWTNYWTDVDNSTQEWGPQIVENVAHVFDSIWKDAIDPYLVTITDKWKDFTGILVEEWDKHGSKITDGIGEMVNNAIKLFQKFWDDILKPIIQPFLEMFEWLWNKHLKKVVKEVSDFVGELIVDALEIYNKFIYPVYSMVMNKLAPVWSVLSSTIINVLGSVVAFIVDVVGSIIRTLKGIVEFITGVMTGNWRKAWQGIADIFGGIFDSLVALAKFPLNLIIDGINAFISGLNKIKIPSWVPGVGGKGFYISKIPKLARGGVVDRPTTVQVGEAGREAIMPLQNNTEWIDELADKLNAKGNGQPYQIIVKVGEDTLIDKVVDGINQKSFERNEEVFNL